MNTTETKKKKGLKLEDIFGFAKVLSGKKEKLVSKIRAMNKDCDAVKNKHMTHIRKFAKEAGIAESDLIEVIDLNKDAFESPKTYEVHGLKIGLTKSGDKLIVEDTEFTIKQIKAKYPELVKVLVKTEESLIVNAVKNLSADQLKTIKASIEPGTDRAYIKDLDSEVDKLIKSVDK